MLIQYFPLGGSPHGTEILNHHRSQTIFFKYTFLKDPFLKDALF